MLLAVDGRQFQASMRQLANETGGMEGELTEPVTQAQRRLARRMTNGLPQYSKAESQIGSF